MLAKCFQQNILKDSFITSKTENHLTGNRLHELDGVYTDKLEVHISKLTGYFARCKVETNIQELVVHCLQDATGHNPNQREYQ